MHPSPVRHRWIWSYSKFLHLLHHSRRTVNPAVRSLSTPAHFDQTTYSQITADDVDSKINGHNVSEDAVLYLPDISPSFAGEAKRSTTSASEGGRLRSFKQHLSEADMLDLQHAQTRLVDDSTTKQDFALWVALLRFRKRLESHHGAWAIYEGLRSRKIDLPTEGQHADELWHPIAIASLNLGRFEDLWRYSVSLFDRRRRRYTKLYSIVVGWYISGNPQDAWKWHKRFQDLRGRPVNGDLRPLMASLPIGRFSAKVVKTVYKASADRDLYDVVVRRLCDRRRYESAVSWHYTLLDAGDHPSSLAVVSPLLQHLLLSGNYEERGRLILSLKQIGIKAQARVLDTTGAIAEPFPVATTPIMTGRRLVSDGFCARAFATRAFTPGAVIGIMRTFGVRAIGPHSMRELAVRCRDLVATFGVDLSNPHDALAREVTIHLAQLQEAGIILENRAFTRLVSKLARAGQGLLLDAVLSSDQHPDVYEDEELQMKLLHSYLHAEDWPQVHRTLAVLYLEHGNAIVTAWNLLLRAYMDPHIQRGQAKLMAVLETMRAFDVRITTMSIRHSYFNMLVPYKSGTAMDSALAVNRLRFMTQLWLEALSTGTNIPARGWSYVLRHYGTNGLLDELERLCLWLAQHYARARSGAIFRRRSTRQINLVFPPLMQGALVEWHFKSLLYPDREFPPRKSIAEITQQASGIEGVNIPDILTNTEPWARGLSLLALLRKAGLQLDMKIVRRACRNRLKILFGAGMSSKPENQAARKNNPHTLEHMVTYLNDLWLIFDGRPIFPTASVAELPAPGNVQERAKLEDHSRRTLIDPPKRRAVRRRFEHLKIIRRRTRRAIRRAMKGDQPKIIKRRIEAGIRRAMKEDHEAHKTTVE